MQKNEVMETITQQYKIEIEKKRRKIEQELTDCIDTFKS